MDIELLTIFMFGALVLLLVLGLPFAFATGGTAVIFLIYLWGPPALMLIVMRIWDLMGSFILVAVPMFIFMGAVLERSGIAAALY
ncbi:TRAP transporter large permease subunit, partial [Thermodesulfovibrionales bacterium]|nr:TRAP transporter large permease subunit [Thermodesulfovibrionales bacterium]